MNALFVTSGDGLDPAVLGAVGKKLGMLAPHVTALVSSRDDWKQWFPAEDSYAAWAKRAALGNNLFGEAHYVAFVTDGAELGRVNAHIIDLALKAGKPVWLFTGLDQPLRPVASIEFLDGVGTVTT